MHPPAHDPPARVGPDVLGDDIGNEDGSCDEGENCTSRLLKNAYDPARVPDDKFDTLLKYAASIKGSMRDMAMGEAKQKVSEDDAWAAELESGMETEADLILEKKKPRPPEKVTQRARDMIEMLQ